MDSEGQSDIYFRVRRASYPANRRKPNVEITEHYTADFAAMLRHLRIAGYGINSVSMYANLSRSAVRNYFAGSIPLHPHGERLIKLFCEVSGTPRDRIPIKRDLPTVSGSRS
jgi:hypothetical protein